MSKELLGALDTLESEKGIKKEVVIDALEAALVSAYKRNYGQAQNVEVDFDQIKGNIHVYAVKEVVEDVFDSRLEVSLQDALEINKAYEIGDDIRFEVTPRTLAALPPKRPNRSLCNGCVKRNVGLSMTNTASTKMKS